MYIAIIVKGSEIMKSFMLKFFKKYGGMLCFATVEDKNKSLDRDEISVFKKEPI